MAKKKTTKTKRKNYEYVGKVYVCCPTPVPVKKMADWLANNATLDVDFESGDACPFDDGVGISIEWDSLKETK
jgi:hypothetical protein